MTREEMIKMYEENERLVKYTMNLYYRVFIKDEDVMQIARIGLWKAVLTYKPERGKFSGYAVICIKHEVDRHFQTANYECRKADLCSLDEVLIDDGPGHSISRIDTIAGVKGKDFVDYEGIKKELDPKQRIIFDLLANGYEQKDAARVLGCSRQAVSLKVQKIRKVVEKYV